MTTPRIIAEISGNHLGSKDRAKKLIDAAKESGATDVKFQHFTPDTITTRGDHPDLVVSGASIWEGRHLWDLYSEAMTPWVWTEELVKHCEEMDIGWFSSPFDESAVDFLEGFSPSTYKIASFEIIDLPLVRRVAATGKPMIISTGMATAQEISDAIHAAESSGATDITLLRTNSAYPAQIDEMDLLAIRRMKQLWGYPVGLSDHTLGNTAALVAVGLGAIVFEKHLTLSRSDGGPDAAFSSEPHELATYSMMIRDACASLGSERFGPSPRERGSLKFRPSLRAIQDIDAGEVFSASNVQSVRPAGGLLPTQISTVIGRRASRRLLAGDPIGMEDLSE